MRSGIVPFALIAAVAVALIVLALALGGPGTASAGPAFARTSVWSRPLPANELTQWLKASAAAAETGA